MSIMTIYPDILEFKIIISLSKVDNIFNTKANIPYGPPANTDIDNYDWTFSYFFVIRHVMLVMIYVWVKRSQCLPYNADHQAWLPF